MHLLQTQQGNAPSRVNVRGLDGPVHNNAPSMNKKKAKLNRVIYTYL